MRVAIAHLGRAAGMGEGRRVWSWTAAAEAAGFDVIPIPLLAAHRARLPDPRGMAALAARHAVPESLAWDRRGVRRQLEDIDVGAVVCLTARAFRPAMAPAGAAVVLDFVDRLSVSYRDRAVIAASPPLRIGFRLLAAAHRRFEGAGRTAEVRLAAAGRHDAAVLGAEWFPNLVEVASVARREPGPDGADLLFFGNLAYPPNIAAVRRLATLWPALQERRPGTTVLLAGAQPSAEVRDLAARCGWAVDADFTDLTAVSARARLAVAPLVHTAGIQNKVLEAAAHGMAQVVSTEAAAGLDPAFPVTVAADDVALVDAVTVLLDDPAERRRQGEAGRAHVATAYSPAPWAEVVARLLT